MPTTVDGDYVREADSKKIDSIDNAFVGKAGLMQILVAIASYGSQNDAHLSRLIAEYRSMSYGVDVVVVSNLPKSCGAGVEVRVGLPNRDPKSLPFAHKRVLADQIDNYDLFIYSEDDILITERNIEAFLQASTELPEDEVPGFLRFEICPNGEMSFCDVHGGFRWAARSVSLRGDHSFAFFANEHAACYLLTRQQLRRALDSGGYLVAPHKGQYNMLETAATDPYTQCGLKKMICISRLDDFLVHHLPNKYVHQFGVSKAELQRQIDTLLTIGPSPTLSAPPLIREDTNVAGFRYAKDYYEPAREDVISLLPDGARSVLSIGCGATEVALFKKGLRVVAIPIDPVFSTSVDVSGIEIVKGSMRAVEEQLAHERFDCLLLLNVLHLMQNPVELLASLKKVSSENSKTIAVTPQISGLRFLWGLLRRNEGVETYREAGIHIMSRKLLREWFVQAGIRLEKTINVMPPKLRVRGRLLGGLLNPVLAAEIIAVGSNALDRSECCGRLEKYTNPSLKGETQGTRSP